MAKMPPKAPNTSQTHGPGAQAAPESQAVQASGTGSSAIETEETQVLKTVWVKEGESMHPVQIKTGMTDETSVEIISGLKEGQLVVISMDQVKASAAKTESASSPFMPKRPGSASKK